MPRESLGPAQRSKIRRTATPGEPPPHGAGGELNVVPFLDILLNVLMFVLATVAVTFTTALDSAPPRRDGTTPPSKDRLSLSVAVLHDGFLVSARGQRIAEGCEGPGAGLAVGRDHDGERDYEGLTSCVRKLKALAADGEKDVVLTAANDVRYDAIIRTMDAVRGPAGEELFPKVSFAVPR
jgi:biopolymer transport protein ExbD